MGTQRVHGRQMLGAARPAPPARPVTPGLLERAITAGIVLFHPQRYLHSTEPFYKRGGSPALDAEYVTDESFEHEDTRAHNLWPGGTPFDPLDFGFGPLNIDCLLNHLKKGWDVVWAWFTFWFPWLLDWAVTPFMGVALYCALKGSQLFSEHLSTTHPTTLLADCCHRSCACPTPPNARVRASPRAPPAHVCTQASASTRY